MSEEPEKIIDVEPLEVEEIETPMDRVKELYEKYKLAIIPTLIIVGSIIGGILIASFETTTTVLGTILALIIIGGFIIAFKFVNFFKSPRRMEQTFNQFHGQFFLSAFYRIYFPVFIIGFLGQFVLQLMLAPSPYGLGLLDYQSISPSFFIIYTFLSFVIALGIMALSDYEMKKNNLNYSAKVSKSPFIKGMGYALPLVGLYFGVVFFVHFFVQSVFGLGALIPSDSVSFQPDQGVNRAAKFWDLLTDNEKVFILITFFLVYIAVEVFMRGYMFRLAEGYNLGAAGMVFVPAVLAATAFTSGISLFTDPIYYIVTVFDAMLLGVILGIVLWRTGNFSLVVVTALFVKIMDTRVEFQRVILHMLPSWFGVYNPYDNVITLADKLGEYFIYLQIALVTISPFILIVSYEEVFKVMKTLYISLKKQWFGILALGIAFVLIDLIFSFVTSLVGAFLGFVVGIMVIGFVLRIFFRILPEPTEIPVLHSETDMFDGELPLNLKKDIEYLDEGEKWYYNPKRNGIIGAFFFIYFLFLSAAYRQYVGLDLFSSLKFTVFLVILPTVLIGLSIYLITRAHALGYFFSETWRTTLILVSIVVFFGDVLIWTQTTSTVNFRWSIIPISVIFTLLIWPKPVENPVRDLSLGFARDGRYATFRYVESNPALVEENFKSLTDMESSNIRIGAYIAAAKQNMLDNEEIVLSLRNRKSLEDGIAVGMILALGIKNYRAAEGVLLDILGDDDINLVMASYWSLGRIGSERALGRMAKVLEGSPKKDLVPIAERSILNIDPNYPLAGIRDSIKISQ